ncbi:hypothetical protein HJFPF1_11504 [Paramyrothecium foliicola]|nr:hypothetical protein HJFPF1_11504 [Paramyrothecium foliicola]
MASWYSSLVTKTSSQISSLRSNLLSSEADGDTEDDTHVCRVLRNYYTEKGRPFPPWLPPDPKAPKDAPIQPVYAQPQVGSRYGGLGGQNNAQGGGGGLSSLWDSNPSANQAPAPQSLRAGRGVGSAPPAMSQMGRPGNEPPSSRPLPSQQRPNLQQTPSGGGGGTAGSSAQDRLRQRLWGGARTTSPQSNQGQGPFTPPAPNGGGGGGNYEDRFAPGGSYDGGRRGGGNDAPYVSANAPWSGGGDDFGGGGYGGGGGGGGGGSSGRPAPPAPAGGSGRRIGLPSGPRGFRQNVIIALGNTWATFIRIQPTMPASSSASSNPADGKPPKKSGGWRSLFQSPASKAYNEVLGGGDKEKVKALVKARDESSPSGSFVLGVYKPISASVGYEDYYTAKAGTGKG